MAYTLERPVFSMVVVMARWVACKAPCTTERVMGSRSAEFGMDQAANRCSRAMADKHRR